FASSAALALGGVKLLDRFLESLPLDKAHGIKGPAVRVLAHRVDRDNAGMFQPAGNLGLAEKAVATLRIAGVQRTQTFQRDLAVQLLILGDVDFAQAALGMKAQDLVARSRGQGFGRPGDKASASR